jgi:hypothetical protein
MLTTHRKKSYPGASLPVSNTHLQAETCRFTSYQALHKDTCNYDDRYLSVDVLTNSEEAGQNTSTITLRVLRRDEKEPSACGYNRATLFLGGYKYGDSALQVGEVSNLRQ